MRLRFLVLAALCVCVPTLAAGAEGDAPPLPERNPLRQTGPVAAPVKPPPPPLPGEQPTVAWTDAEIDAAKAKCRELLTGDPLDYEPLPPIKEGICGTPAPVLLRAIGTDQKVVVDPPATMSCPMADVLGEWLRDTIQPEAKKLFGSPVVKILNSSSYVCRNRYGGASTPLSEHALANAFDVSEFVLADGTRITILDDWPKVVATPPAPEANPNRVSVSKEGDTQSKPEKTDKVKSGGAATKTGAADKAKGGATKTSAITAPKASPDASPSPPPVAKEPELDPKARFVTFLHEDACRRFGTVLGPDANAAHNNHFHLDMKKRRRGFCE